MLLLKALHGNNFLPNAVGVHHWLQHSCSFALLSCAALYASVSKLIGILFSSTDQQKVASMVKRACNPNTAPLPAELFIADKDIHPLALVAADRLDADPELHVGLQALDRAADIFVPDSHFKKHLRVIASKLATGSYQLYWHAVSLHCVLDHVVYSLHKCL